MSWLRSLLFNIAMILWTFGIGVASLPVLLVKPDAVTAVADRWTAGLLALLRVFCGIQHRIEGGEHCRSGVLYAAKHQSAWETIALWRILRRPVFILKKELLSIPVFGPYLKRVPHVAIDRSAGSKALRQMIEQSRAHLQAGRSIVIFPEGTRTLPGESRPYRSGVASLYAHLDVPVVPVALNSGCYWRKNAFRKRPGEVIVRFLPPIGPGMEKDAFLALLQEHIERESRALLPAPPAKES